MLETNRLSFAYNAGRPDAIPALQDITLRIAPGELVAIIGNNGSGKSTLAKLLTAMLTPTEGSISVDGISSTPANVWEVRRRVGMVFQRPDDQLVANTVIDDIAFGPENLGLPRDVIDQRIREAIAALNLNDVAHAQISELSGGEKQRVAIAGVLAMQPSYLILDEPTTMIAPRMARQLIALAHDLRRRVGLAVLHITHFMREVVSFDRVIVMDGGCVLMDDTPHKVFARMDELQAIGLSVPLVTKVAQRLRTQGVDLPEAVLTTEELARALEARGQHAGRSAQWSEVSSNGSPPDGQMPHRISKSAQFDERPLIAVRDLHYTYLDGTPLAREALHGVDCTVSEGETLAILGGTQAGKSTLIEFFNALRLPEPGHVFFAGQDVAASDFDLGRLRQSVGVVFQQPETQLFEDTVGSDVSYALRRKGLPPAESRAIVEQVLTDVGLDYEAFRLRYIYALSGGQKRRVAIAGALASKPRVLILDEPIAGLDPRGRADLAALITDLTRRLGLTVVLVGNAVDELAQLADRAIVMSQGRVALEGSLRDLLRRADELHALGLELSQTAEIALALRPLLPDLPSDLLEEQELEEALLKRLALGDERLA